MSVPSDDEVRRFAEELVDNLRAAETVAERDAADIGKRLSVEELVEALGIELDDEGEVA